MRQFGIDLANDLRTSSEDLTLMLDRVDSLDLISEDHISARSFDISRVLITRSSRLED